jgi:predicted CoA-substrate-specific enzyme activase
MHFVGIDIGSTMTKVVLMNLRGQMVSAVKGPTGPEHRQLANEVLGKALEQAGLGVDRIAYVVATGYGRVNVPFADCQVTELTCHARGVSHLFPGVRTAIDIGGQDAKCMKIRDGKLQAFLMNDKCAAGTGRFMELIADTLGIRLEELGGISLMGKNGVPIGNLCTIFAQQEVISALSEGAVVEDILAGLHDALASRVAALARRLKVEAEVVFTGGVAKNAGIVKALEENLGCRIRVPEEPLLTGALGAALLAADQFREAMKRGKPISSRNRELERPTFFE